MTEEIIKECKNCDALGFDSEIGVYYCCLSHRQDDLPKEFTCDDFVPNKQLLRLEQENKELKIVKEQLKKWNDENLKRQDDMQLWIDLAEEQRRNYRSALEKIRNLCIHYENTNDKCVINCYAHFIVTDLIQTKINEVLND